MNLQALCPSSDCLYTKSKSTIKKAKLDRNYPYQNGQTLTQAFRLSVIELTYFLDGSFESIFLPSLHA